MVRNNGEADLFGRHDLRDAPGWQPTHAEMEDETWRTNGPVERAVMAGYIRQNFHWSVALDMAQHPAWAKHVLTYEVPLKCVEFSQVHMDAHRLGIDPQAILDQMGYARPKPAVYATGEDSMARLNRRAEQQWQRDLAESAAAVGEEEDDDDAQEAPGPRETGRLASKAQSALNDAIRLVTGGRKAKSQTPEGRRARHITAKAKRLRITVAETEALTPRHTKDKT